MKKSKMEESLIVFFQTKCEEHGYKNGVLKNIRVYKQEKETYAIADVEYTYKLNAWDKQARHYNMTFMYKKKRWSCAVLFGIDYLQEDWEIVHDCDLEDGTPAVWSLKVADRTWYWIDAMSDGTYNVIGKDNESVLKTCKSLVSAKRWVTKNLL